MFLYICSVSLSRLPRDLLDRSVTDLQGAGLRQCCGLPERVQRSQGCSVRVKDGNFVNHSFRAGEAILATTDEKNLGAAV